jgi:putative restriction endonuclease
VNYWWVSQNQTYDHEIGNGYMWAPQSRTRVGWLNMTRVKPGDVIFSFRKRLISAVGIATSAAYDSMKPSEFGSAGEAWDDHGWRVDVEYQVPGSVVEPRKHMDLIAPLLPDVHSPLQKNGDGNMVYLSALSIELGQLLLKLSQTENLHANLELDNLEYDEIRQESIVIDSLIETEKESMVLSRRGQGTFRRRVRLFEEACRITGVKAEKLLIASHIKPWADSNNMERLDGNNGLFLSPHVDRLFDKGYITFTKNGSIEVSPLLDPDVLKKWHIDPRQSVGRFNSDQASYLEHHGALTFQAKK